MTLQRLSQGLAASHSEILVTCPRAIYVVSETGTLKMHRKLEVHPCATTTYVYVGTLCESYFWDLGCFSSFVLSLKPIRPSSYAVAPWPRSRILATPRSRLGLIVRYLQPHTAPPLFFFIFITSDCSAAAWALLFSTLICVKRFANRVDFNFYLVLFH